MSDVSECAAARLINFYINEASRECIEGRKIYLRECILPRLKDGLSLMHSWKEKTDEDLELISIYQKGVDFLTKTLKQEVYQLN